MLFKTLYSSRDDSASIYPAQTANVESVLLFTLSPNVTDQQGICDYCRNHG
ncbi:MAG: hypothetical protein EWM72_02858 [Nitrospira sp.]|nr:MAG: hypothetical protein EWM72_02858 [Nitrospira sp.]